MKEWIFGIDIGGTKIAVSLGHASGRIRAKKIFTSLAGREPDASIEEIRASFDFILNSCRIQRSSLLGAGLAVAGAVDVEKGLLLKAPHLSRWEKIPLRKKLSARLGIPVYIENDANAAALGERYFGVGKRYSNFVYVTVSTGIGSGIIANGELLRGEGGSAGEIGHMTVVPHGLRCDCGKRGCLEAYASGTAIANRARFLLRKGKKSLFLKAFKPGEITGNIISDGANRGDRVSVEARKIAARYLGIGLANVLNLLNPAALILGGGVMENPAHFWKPMMESIRVEAWPDALRRCRILHSRLGKKVGDLGAVAVVLEACRNKS